MQVLLIDTETTGLDFQKDRVLEIGFQVTNETFRGVQHFGSLLMWDRSYPELSEEIIAITGISMKDLAMGHDPMDAFQKLSLTIESFKPEVVVAYNADFDFNMLKNEIARNGAAVLPGIDTLMKLPWVCAMVDLESNYKHKCWKLSHLALEYGVTVNPKELHRALPDVNLTRELLVASGQDAKALLKFKNVPWSYVQAVTKAPWDDNGKSNTLAKAHGFSWESAKGDFSGKKFTKKWVKRIKSDKFDKETESCPLQINLL